jgi:hypothetical protein
VFNLLYANGEPVGFNEVNRITSENNIQIRTGCFCNLGGCQFFLRITGKESEEFYHLGRVCSDGNDIDVVNSRQTGACRVSLGFGSTKSDCDQFLSFLKTHFLNKIPANPLESMSLQNKLSLSATSLLSKSSYPGLQNEENFFWHHQIENYPVHQNQSSLARAASPDLSKNEVILSAIFIYPIKSCAGIRVNHWPITRDGLKYDRYLAIIENSSGKVVTQKQYPVLALIQPSFHLEKIEITSYHYEEQEAQSKCQEMLTLHISSSLMESVLVIPLQSFKQGQTSEKENRLELGEFNICGRKVFGSKISKDANEWFTEFLNKETSFDGQHEEKRKVRKSFSLIQHSSNCSASSSTANTEDSCKTNTSDTQSFANTSQYLLLSMESIKALIQVREPPVLALIYVIFFLCFSFISVNL